MKRMGLTLSLTLLVAVTGVLAAEEATMHTTASGLQYQVLRPGQAGTEPHPGDRVVVHYTGRFTDGTKFDSSRDRGQPFTFTLGLGEVIAGWDEALALMTVQSVDKVVVPWKLAYGEEGRRGIPPKSDLVFEIELLQVIKGKPLPVFAKPDATKQQTTASGLKYEVLKDGAGTPPKPEQFVRLEFSLWNTDGELLLTSVSMAQPLSGVAKELQLGPQPLKFMPEAVELMKPGGVYRFEVPATLAWGEAKVHPKLPGGSTTLWQMELLEVKDLPAFAKLDSGKKKTTPSGLGYQVITEGKGRKPGPTDEVTVNYSGWLDDGTLFDSSFGRGEPVTFPLNRVIPGWTEGLQLMREGSVYRFSIPGRLAYGSRPPEGAGIPPDATLNFYVELISVGAAPAEGGEH